MGPRFEDCVCNGDQPSGDGDDDEFVRLATHLEALRDGLQNRIVTSGGKCGLEQDMSQCAPSSSDCSLASHRSAVVWDRCKAGHGCGLAGCHSAEFRHFRDQHTHDLASLIRTCVLLAAQGWRDHDDADVLRHDPAFRLAACSAAGLTPLEGPGLASRPTLSRFTAIMAEPANIKVLRDAVLEMAGRGIRA